MCDRSEQLVLSARSCQDRSPDGKYWLTIHEVAEHFGISRGTVSRWIRSGLLLAIDVSPNSGPGLHRPSWRISSENLENFIESRASTPPPPPKAKPRRKQAGIVEFIK